MTPNTHHRQNIFFLRFVCLIRVERRKGWKEGRREGVTHHYLLTHLVEPEAGGRGRVAEKPWVHATVSWWLTVNTARPHTHTHNIHSTTAPPHPQLQITLSGPNETVLRGIKILTYRQPHLGGPRRATPISPRHTSLTDTCLLHSLLTLDFTSNRSLVLINERTLLF